MRAAHRHEADSDGDTMGIGLPIQFGQSVFAFMHFVFEGIHELFVLVLNLKLRLQTHIIVKLSMLVPCTINMKQWRRHL